MSDDAPVGRRARLRAQTTADILRTAGEHVAAEGAGALSLRAVARDLGMGVSSLYRYFASRDDLLTALLVDAFTDQADAVAAAAARHRDPADALRAVCRAYRNWAQEHPSEFALAYGTPVPGYIAPADRTIPPAVRVGGIIVDLLQQARAAGRIAPEHAEQRDAALTQREREGLQELIDRRGYDLPPGLMSLTVDLFVRVHGYVAMEAFGQLRPLTADPATTFDRAVDEALAATGLDQ